MLVNTLTNEPYCKVYMFVTIGKPRLWFKIVECFHQKH